MAALKESPKTRRSPCMDGSDREIVMIPGHYHVFYDHGNAQSVENHELFSLS